MEAVAVLQMFKRLISKCGVCYTKYAGDIDSKTYSILSRIMPYSGIILMSNLITYVSKLRYFQIFLGKKVEKIEDLNHFSKRMKRGLETVERSYGRKKLLDGETIDGKNRLSSEYLDRRRYKYTINFSSWSSAAVISRETITKYRNPEYKKNHTSLNSI